MKKALLILSICSICGLKAYSQTKQQSIKELFVLMKQEQMIDNTFNSMLPMMRQAQMNLSKYPAAKAESEAAMKTNMQTMKATMKKFMNEDMVQIYDKHFTQSEIKNYIAFYKTPAGQKMINVMPGIQKDVMTVMMQKYMPALQKQMVVPAKK